MENLTTNNVAEVVLVGGTDESYESQEKFQWCTVWWKSNTTSWMERSNKERISEHGKESRMESN